MGTRRIASFEWLLLFGVILLAWASPSIVYGQTPTHEYIIDLLTTPNKYWNKFVMIHGHVRSVVANPPGTNRGSYVMRDSTDSDITVLTNELPAMGKEYTVSGNVEQLNPDERVPVLREVRRVVGIEVPQAVPSRRPANQELAAEPGRKKETAPPPAPPPAVAQPVPAPGKQAAPAIVPPAPLPVTPAMPWPMIVTIAALAILLVVVLLAIMRPKAAPAPAAPVTYAPHLPPPAPRTQPAPVRPVAPPPSAMKQAVASAGADVPTQALSQPTLAVDPPAGKATEVYMDLQAELVVNDGPDRGKRFKLTKPAITIGRGGGRQNDVTLSDSTVSREHAQILFSTSELTFRLINDSTTNPARLNGNPVDKAALKDGDVIQLGASVLQFKRT